MNKYFFTIALVFLSFVLFSQAKPEWKLTGPSLFPENISGQINGIGRVTQLKFHPSDPKKLYATSASGGLWFSADEGKIWKNMGTDFLPKLNCASVCIDYTNDSIIYLGTGDPNYYFNSLGIYKTTDAGKTWVQKNSGLGNLMALEILMDPLNNKELIAATSNGIYKTLNGGDSWTKVYNSGSFTDMLAKPEPGSRIVYASTLSDFYRSTDFGNTWTIINNGLISGDNQGCRIAVSPKNPSVVYFAMVKNEGMIYRSNDSGISFSQKRNNASQSITGYDASTPGQGNYNFGITADPTNENIVYTVSHCVWKSTDGGSNFTKLTDWPSILHTDMHQIIFSPYNSLKLYNVNDGGIFVSETENRSNWVPLSDHLAATECYHASTSPIRYDMTSIGTQDNGGLTFVDNGWKTNRGGDWSSVEKYDYSDLDQVYYLGNARRRSTSDGGKAQEQTLNNSFLIDNNSKIIFSPYFIDLAFVGRDALNRTLNLNNGKIIWQEVFKSNSSVANLYFSTNNLKRLYVVLNNRNILICNNYLNNELKFDKVMAPASTSFYSSLIEMDGNENVLIFSSGTKIYKSLDAGKTWQDYSTGLPSINWMDIKQDIHSLDKNLYIASAKGVYTRNANKLSWELYTNNLPSIADITEFMDFNNGSDQSALRVAFYGRGVWEVPFLRTDSLKANFSFFNGTCREVPIQFINKSYGEPNIIKWEFPGGNPESSKERNPIVYYSTPGKYSAKLIVEKGNTADTMVLTNAIDIKDLPNTTLSRRKDSIYANPASSYQWLKNGSYINNANLQYYIPKTTGAYSVIITDSNYCVNESETMAYPFTVGIEKNNQLSKLEIFPNPVVDQLRFSFSCKIPSELKMEVSDINGKIILQKNTFINLGTNSIKIDLKDLSAGNYFLNLKMNNEVLSEKFMVK